MTVSVADIQALPAFPSNQVLQSLPPSQQASILKNICSALSYALALPDTKLRNFPCNVFLTSYVRDKSLKILSDLVYSENDNEVAGKSSIERTIRRLALQLAQRLASVPKASNLELQTFVDLAVVYGRKNSSKIKSILQEASSQNPSLVSELRGTAIPTFSYLLLSQDSGLHALRKTIHCISAFIHCSPSSFLSIFSGEKEFVLTLAKCYDSRLGSIANSYSINIDGQGDDETTKLWIECKVAIIDVFHIILQDIVSKVKNAPAQNVEYAFDLVFALLDLPSSSSQSANSIPFLNRPLVADYQHSYSLSSTLHSTLSNKDDARLDLLSATLTSFDEQATGTAEPQGALKLLLLSSGITSGVAVSQLKSTRTKGKEREPMEQASSVSEKAVGQVLDILPDYDSSYIRRLLGLPQYIGDPERVIAALLEDDAPPESSLPPISTIQTSAPNSAIVIERQNVFNNQRMDISNVTIGKRQTDADNILRDRSFLDQMKLDILRRAAEVSDSEDGEEDVELDENGKPVRIAAFEDEIDELDDGRVKVVADGENSDEGGSSEDEGEPLTPEAICEMAYLEDPKVFDRDAETRRSKARADLRGRTGWADEQIEGWRVMLERNPRKDKILQKHEFAGNRKGLAFTPSTSGQSGPSNERGHDRGGGRGGGGRGGRGGGRGRGRGAGSGRGGGNAGGEGNSDGGRGRAWKDKHKARMGNHDRKRGHDKKMARGGGGPSGSV